MLKGLVRRGVVLSVLALAVAGVARAAEPAAAEAEAAALRARVAELEKRLAELEQRLAQRGAGSDPEAVKELERKVDILTEELQQLRQGENPAAGPRSAGPRNTGPAAGKVYGVAHGVSIGGYGEAIYQDPSSRREDGTPSGEGATADLQRAVLYFGYKFDDRIVFNSEVEWEHASTEQGGEAAAEFAYLDFLLHRSFNPRAGLVLVPIGLINEMHEPPTFLGARRPDVEQIILPTTWREVGVGAWGDIGLFSYKAYVLGSLRSSGFSSALGISEGRTDGAESPASSKAVVVRFDLSGIPGLLAGVSWYQGNAGNDAALPSGHVIDAKVTVFDVHADWKWRGLQLRGVYGRDTVDDALAVSEQVGETVGSKMEGWYAEAGYDVLSATRWNRQSLIPFVRYETYDTQAEVPPELRDTVTGENDRTVITYGLVYKPIPQVAIKLDYQDYSNRAHTGVDQFNAALGFMF